MSRLQRSGPLALLLVVLVLVAFPFYWMLLTSVTPREALFKPPYRLFRLDFSLGNYRELLFATEFARYFVNSLIAAVGAIVLNVIAATLAGYGLTRFAFPGKKTFAFGTLFSYMFPPMLMAIPLYILFSALQMRNTYTGLILAHMAISLPLNIWLMWQYFQIVPLSLEEAAWTSGASRLAASRQAPALGPAGHPVGGHLLLRALLERLHVRLHPPDRPQDVHAAGWPRQLRGADRRALGHGDGRRGAGLGAHLPARVLPSALPAERFADGGVGARDSLLGPAGGRAEDL